MGFQDKLRARVTPFLEPGAQLRQVILVEAGPSPWLRVGIVIGVGVLAMVLLVKPMIIAVTDTEIIILRASRWRAGQPREVLARLPRQTRLGPANGKAWAKLNVAGQSVWVHRRYFDAVRAADQPLMVPPSTPPAGFEPAASGFAPPSDWGRPAAFDRPMPTAATNLAGQPPPLSREPLAGSWEIPSPSPPGPTGPAPAGPGYGPPPQGPPPSTAPVPGVPWARTPVPGAPPAAAAGTGAYGGAYGPGADPYRTISSAPGAQPGTWPLDEGRGRPWKWVLIGIVGLLVGLGVIGTVANNNESSAQDRLKAYITGSESHPYVAADGQFRASYPGLPRRVTHSDAIAGGTLETIGYERDLGLDTSFIISFVDLPIAPADAIGALNAGANAFAVGIKGQILDSKQTAFAGHPAIEFTADAHLSAGTKSVHYARVTLVLDDRRLFTVAVLGPKNPPDGYDNFIASFTILP